MGSRVRKKKGGCRKRKGKLVGFLSNHHAHDSKASAARSPNHTTRPPDIKGCTTLVKYGAEKRTAVAVLERPKQ